jgi:hypothetical protein
MRKLSYVLPLFAVLPFLTGCAGNVATTKPAKEVVTAEAANAADEVGRTEPEQETKSPAAEETLALEPLVPPSNLTEPDLVGSQSPEPSEAKECTPWYKSWVFWTVVGAAAVGATTGLVLALDGSASAGGPYDYHIQRE